MRSELVSQHSSQVKLVHITVLVIGWLSPRRANQELVVGQDGYFTCRLECRRLQARSVAFKGIRNFVFKQENKHFSIFKTTKY